MKTEKSMRERIKEGFYANKVEYPKIKRVRDNHVFDADKSVNWNKEEVIRHNKEVDEAVQEYRNESGKAYFMLVDDIKNELKNDYKFSDKTVNNIIEYASNKRDDYMSFYDIAIEAAELFV